MDGSLDSGGTSNGSGPPPGNAIFEAAGEGSMQGIEQAMGEANGILARGMGGDETGGMGLQVLNNTTYPMAMDLTTANTGTNPLSRRQSIVPDFTDTMMSMDEPGQDMAFMDTTFDWSSPNIISVSQSMVLDTLSIAASQPFVSPVGGVVQSIDSMGLTSPTAETNTRPGVRRSSTSVSAVSDATQGSMMPPPVPSEEQQQRGRGSVSESSSVPSPAVSSTTMSAGTPQRGGGLAVEDEPPAHARKPPSLENAYSQSGFNFMKLLHEIENRPNRQIDIGAVDMSCSFVVTDNRLHDNPIVYVSPTFEVLTEYSRWEIRGQNCRFLQSPHGKVDAGSVRTFTDGETVKYFKRQLERGREAQATLLNYRKGGMPFVNLLTMIPVSWEGEKNALFVGFQIDLVDHPEAIQKRNKNGSVDINYSYHPPPQAGLPPPGMMPIAVQQQQRRQIAYPMVDNVARILTSSKPTNSTQDKEIWDKMVLEQSDDLLHVLSLKGTILYCSPSVKRLLGYEPDALVGHSLSAYCHPSDIVPVTRDLKDTASGTTINIVYRMRQHADKGGYRWFESHGALHTEAGKGKKCIILAGRPISVYRLPRSLMTHPATSASPSTPVPATSTSDTELWMKLSISGIILYISSKSRALLDYDPKAMIAQSLTFYTREESGKEILTLLRQMADDARPDARELRHEMLHQRGHYQQVSTVFYNGGHADPGHPPTFLIAQTKFLKSPRKGSSRARETSTSTSASTPRPQGPQHLYNHPSTAQSPIRIAEQLGLHTPDDDDLFQQLKLTRSSSWQYELRQMEKTNKKLQEEVAQLLAQRKKRKRRRGAEQLMKECVNCHVSQTPEWRKGPSGKRDLCNGCGLRYAKMLTSEKSKTAASQASRSQQGDTTPTTTTTAAVTIPPPRTAVGGGVSNAALSVPSPSVPTSSASATSTGATSNASTAPTSTSANTDKPTIAPVSQIAKVQGLQRVSPVAGEGAEEPGGT